MRKLEVIFPGMGYTSDRPLLYYTGKQAVKCGYELVRVDFSGLAWNKEMLKDKEFLHRAMETCLRKTTEALLNLGDISGDEIVFISKSIGTAVATAYAKERSIHPLQICFSPLELIGDYIEEGSGILFYGDNDPYADYRAIEKIAEDKRLERYRIAGGNHSLETGDLPTDLDNLKNIVLRAAEVFRT